MKTQKKKNVIAKGSCFIATLLLHIYSIEIMHVNIIITIGLGIITLVIGFLFMDAIRRYIEHSRKDDKFYLDYAISHESEVWLERYTELLNVQKASYTATKKNGEYQKEQFESLFSRLDALEKRQESTLQMILELQKKALEGQKKAVNIEINHSNENANKIIEILKDRSQQAILSNQFEKLLSQEEDNQTLFQEQLQRFEKINDRLEVVERIISQEPTPSKVFMEDYYQEDALSDHELSPSDSISYQENEVIENASEANQSYEDLVPEADSVINELVLDDDTKEISSSDENASEPMVVPLYEDPNKALTADEIAKLFASFGQ